MDMDGKRLLLRDVTTTLGSGRVTADEQRYLASRVEREWDARYERESAADHVRRAVDNVQQVVHDEFIDTTWPACPRHVNHPLWFHDGWWTCELDGVAIARLGNLKPHA